jgi:hypothetical protein
VIGRWSIAETRGRAVWSVWLGRKPTRDRFEPSDARGEAADVHAARLAAFGAFSRARGVTRWAEIDAIYAIADDRQARGVEPVFPGDKRRPAPEQLAPRELPDDLLDALGLAPPITLERARAAYKARALEVHPDRGGSHEQMSRLNQAFDAVREQLEPTAARPRRSSPR